MKKGVSVLTLNKNRSPHLLQQIEGLQRADILPDELVIVEMSDKAPNLPRTPFPIHVIRYNTQSLPLAKARNLAMQKAIHDKMIFLDVDCIPSKNLVQSLQQSLDLKDAIFSPKVLYLPPLDLESGWDEKLLVKAGTAHPVRDFSHQGIRQETNPGLFWSLAFALSKKTFGEIGGFCEDYVGYGGEDTDFGFRAHSKNIPHYFTTHCQAYHQHHIVYEPPYQHFAAIIANAKTFFHRWNTWPMDGWLMEFQKQGFIEWTEKDIVIKTYPTIPAT